MNESAQFAAWLSELRYSDLSEEVVDYTKRFILDDIGCMIGGALQLGNRSVVKDILTAGEVAESTVVYFGFRTSAPSAALINGAFIAGWDYDSMTDAGGGHMGSQTAALLAMGERHLVGGRDLILAECAGIEAQCRIGMTAKVRHDGIGGGGAHPWHSNTTLGPFAAAATSGKILSLDPRKMENAIGIATSNLGGNYQHYFMWGSSMKRVRCGIGAWSGVRAALLAAEGLAGPPEAIEGAKGFGEAIVGRDDGGRPWFESSELTHGLGTEWEIFSYNTKAGGCGCVTTLQCPTLTAVALRDQFHPDPAEIASVEVQFKDAYGQQQGGQILGTELGETPEQRLGSSGWSLQWMVAEALVIGMPGIQEQLANIRPYGKYREIEELSRKVTGSINERYYREHFGDRPHHKWGGRVIVTMNDGRVFEHEPVTHPGCRMSGGGTENAWNGDPINSITMDQLEDKFREQAGVAGISKHDQKAILEIIYGLEKEADLRRLLGYLVPARSAGRA